jgi:hypothetical protein
MLERYNMKDCKPVATPATDLRLPRLDKKDGSKADNVYMSLVGALMYAAMITRPDIAYAVQALARHLQASGPEHWRAAKHVLRYLKGTRDVGIIYNGRVFKDTIIVGYCDADWANDRDTRRSTTGYVIMVAGATISWASKLQPTVALSTSEAEYMAACAAAQEAIYQRQLLKDLGFDQDEATVIYEDNTGAIGLSENPALHSRSKHIDIKYHFVRERVSNGEIKLVHVASEEQLADLLTKPLSKQKVEYLRGKLMGK